MRNFQLPLILVSSLLPFAVLAAPADQPETGQTMCYDVDGIVIACVGTGQDGELRAGVAWSSPRFVVGTGATADCVTDNLTGLMWVRAPSGTATWANALTIANNLTLCGFTDWRLPNVNELESLVNSEVANSAAYLNGQGFTGVQAIHHWSSTTDLAFGAGNAWVVDLGNNRLFGGVGKTQLSYVLPVRAGQ